MTLNQLKYFCTACRTRSITKASEELFVTQPTISIAIKDLEAEFNIILFARHGNHLELTSAGETFYEKAKDLLKHSTEMCIRDRSLTLSLNSQYSPKSSVQSV